MSDHRDSRGGGESRDGGRGGAGGGSRRPFFGAGKSCPFSGRAREDRLQGRQAAAAPSSPSAGKIVPSRITAGLDQEAARACPGDQALALPRPPAPTP